MKSFNETTCGISKALFTSFEKKEEINGRDRGVL
jgi:hypothetical protein